MLVLNLSFAIFVAMSVSINRKLSPERQNIARTVPNLAYPVVCVSSTLEDRSEMRSLADSSGPVAVTLKMDALAAVPLMFKLTALSDAKLCREPDGTLQKRRNMLALSQ